MAAQYTVEELREIITPIARRYGVQSVSLFGSRARRSARTDSDGKKTIPGGLTFPYARL